MGIFNTPGPSVTRKEFERILSDMHSRFSGDMHKDLRALSAGYIAESGAEAGMSGKELEQFMQAARSIVPSSHHGSLGELHERLQKAVKGSYGGGVF